ncbi:unnamed protein product, partial [Ascophyllum nodosum]
SAKPAAPASATNPFAVLGEGNTSSGNSPETQVTAEDSSTREHSSVTLTEPPDSSNLEVEEGEVGSGDADIPDSVARALLDALQEKRMGNQLPAAMAPLARIRASQLQKCISDGTEPQETIIQAALDLIALGKGPSDPAALSDKVSMLETRLDDVQATIASIIDAPTPPRKQHRGRSKSERPATQGRRENSTSRAKNNGKKASRTTRPITCTFQHCMRPTTHRTEDCLFKKLAEKIGSDP